MRYAAVVLGTCLAALTAYVIATQPPSVDTQPFIEKSKDYSVRIIRDNFGVPHIYGKTDADTAFGLAYAHAEDDFATINLWTDSRFDWTIDDHIDTTSKDTTCPYDRFI